MRRSDSSPSTTGWPARLLLLAIAVAGCADPASAPTRLMQPDAQPALAVGVQQTAPGAYFDVRSDVSGIVQSNGFYPQGSDSLRLLTSGQQSATTSGVFGYYAGQYALSGSIGAQTATLTQSSALILNDADLRGGTPSARYTSFNGTITSFVLGPPGTQFTLQRTETCHADASLVTWLGGNFGGNAGNCAAGAINPGDATQSDSSVTSTITGTSTTPTQLYQGQTYSFVGKYAVNGGVNLSTPGTASHVYGQTHSNGTLTIAVQGAAAKQPPVARIVGPSVVSTTTPATYDGSSSFDPDGSIATYRWDITRPGGVLTSYGSRVTYAWATPGTYPISLTVTDNDGLTNTASLNVTVGPFKCDAHSASTRGSSGCCTPTGLGRVSRGGPLGGPLFIADPVRGNATGLWIDVEILPASCDLAGGFILEDIHTVSQQTTCPINDFDRRDFIEGPDVLVHDPQDAYNNEYVDKLSIRNRDAAKVNAACDWVIRQEITWMSQDRTQVKILRTNEITRTIKREASGRRLLFVKWNGRDLGFVRFPQ